MFTRRRLLLGAGAVAAMSGGSPSFAKGRPDGARPLEVGDKAPNFRLRTPDRTLVRLSAHRGQPVLLDFFRTDCRPCLRALPELIELHERFEDKGLLVFLIALLEEVDGRSKLARFLSLQNLPFPVLEDETEFWAKKYLGSVGDLPATFLVDKKGRIAARQFGAPTDGRPFGAVEEAITKILLG